MRLICVSNRLPVTLVEGPDGATWQASSGGLVTALTPILQKTQGSWLGWNGLTNLEEKSSSASYVLSADDLTERRLPISEEFGFDLIPVAISSADSIHGFYTGFSNQIIWPLFHDLQSLCNFEPAFWESYGKVIDDFADTIRSVIAEDDVLWIHDYHLIGLGKKLRDLGVKNRCAYFLHIPFPPPDIFFKLPWRKEVIESLLSYDCVGVQTYRDLNNLADSIQLLSSGEMRRSDRSLIVQHEGRETVVGSFPISIDFKQFSEAAQHPAVSERAAELRKDMGVEHLVLSVDRLDYTKGIPYRLRSFQRMLTLYPELRKKVALLQLVIPSREDVSQYQDLKLEVERLVTQTNGAFGEPGWVPVHHLYRSISRDELLAYYLASDTALITPLKDGMNLVAKEYCAANFREDGVIVLSEFAGAAEELGQDVFLVNPYDLDGVASALAQALQLSTEDRAVSMRKLRTFIETHDVYLWAAHFLNAARTPFLSEYAEIAQEAPLVQRIKNLLKIFQSRNL